MEFAFYAFHLLESHIGWDNEWVRLDSKYKMVSESVIDFVFRPLGTHSKCLVFSMKEGGVERETSW